MFGILIRNLPPHYAGRPSRLFQLPLFQMLTKFPTEVIQKIAHHASPPFFLPDSPSEDEEVEISPPIALCKLSQTCSALYARLSFADNASLYAGIFEHAFDFDAARRRLGVEWTNAHGLAWEGRRRWGTMKRMRRIVAIGETGTSFSGFLGKWGENDAGKSRPSQFMDRRIR